MGKVEAEVKVECEHRWRVEPNSPTGQADGTPCSLLCPRSPGHLNLTTSPQWDAVVGGDQSADLISKTVADPLLSCVSFPMNYCDLS